LPNAVPQHFASAEKTCPTWTAQSCHSTSALNAAVRPVIADIRAWCSILLAETSVCGAASMGSPKLLASNPHAPHFLFIPRQVFKGSRSLKVVNWSAAYRFQTRRPKTHRRPASVFFAYVICSIMLGAPASATKMNTDAGRNAVSVCDFFSYWINRVALMTSRPNHPKSPHSAETA
jgi:hypothetical protein